MGGGASLVLGTTVPWGSGGGGGMPAIFSLSPSAIRYCNFDVVSESHARPPNRLVTPASVLPEFTYAVIDQAWRARFAQQQ